MTTQLPQSVPSLPAIVGAPQSPQAIRGPRSPLAPVAGLAAILEGLEGPDGRGTGGVTCHVVQPPRAPRHAPWPEEIHPAVRRALARRGIEEPYSHQAQAMAHVLAGEDVVVVTPTASGKSLCYAAPLVTRCLLDPDAR